MEIKKLIHKNKYNFKHSLLRKKIRWECYKKWLALDSNLKKISKITDNETKKYWKSLQKKYSNELLNIEYETQKKGVLRKISPSKINTSKTNKSDKAKPSNLKHYIINDKIIDLTNSNNMVTPSKFKNAKTVKF